LSLSDETKHKV